MCGVHYRFDSQEGLLIGEIVAVRLLQQVSTRTRDIDEAFPFLRERQSDHNFEPGTRSPPESFLATPTRAGVCYWMATATSG